MTVLMTVVSLNASEESHILAGVYWALREEHASWAVQQVI